MTRRQGKGIRSGRRVTFVALQWVVLAVLAAILVPIQTVIYGTPLPVALGLGALLCGAPIVAVARPRLAVGLFCLPAFVLPLAVDSTGVWPWPWSVPALIVFSGFVAIITFVHGWKLGLIPLLVSNTGSLAALLILPAVAASNSPLAGLIVAASISSVAFVLALLSSGRMRAARELSTERKTSAEEHSRRVVVEERAHIARELHDVVAHSLSLIQVQASTASYRVPALTGAAATEFEDIAATARGALIEMRALLGVLRTEDHTAELTPQQGIGDIPALVASTRRSGAEVALELVALAPAVPSAVQIAAFRIVQEALSNAVRHSPGALIAVAVHTAEGTLHLSVRNSTAEVRPAAGVGHGLRGMRERVALLGGTLDAGPDEDCGWAVVVALTWGTGPRVDAEPR
jgi:signal transduction histidine kinase